MVAVGAPPWWDTLRQAAQGHPAWLGYAGPDPDTPDQALAAVAWLVLPVRVLDLAAHAIPAPRPPWAQGVALRLGGGVLGVGTDTRALWADTPNDTPEPLHDGDTDVQVLGGLLRHLATGRSGLSTPPLRAYLEALAGSGPGGVPDADVGNWEGALATYVEAAPAGHAHALERLTEAGDVALAAWLLTTDTPGS